MNTHTYTRKWSELYWDFIDANANLERAELIARRISNGMLSGVNFFIMILLGTLAILLTWHFDFKSTYDAFAGLRTHIFPGLPVTLQTGQTAAIVAAIITGVITVAPTLMEIFTSNLARANILVIKVFVLGASIFDVITDIPTTKIWIDSWQTSFDALGPILGFVAYWIFFFMWLIMATVGFQLTAAIFIYLMIIYFRKMVVGLPIPQSSNKQRQQSTKDILNAVKSDNQAKVINVE